MNWYQKQELRPRACEAARSWVEMNPGIPGNPVVIPVSSTSAIIEYEQDQEDSQWLFFFFGKGDKKPLYLSPAALQKEGRRRLESRIKMARHNYRLSQLDVEREKLANN